MQSAPMYVGTAVVQPSLRRGEELDFSTRARLLAAEPMKVEVPASLPRPAASRAQRAPPGLEAFSPPGAFAPPATPPTEVDLPSSASCAQRAPPGLEHLAPLPGALACKAASDHQVNHPRRLCREDSLQSCAGSDLSTRAGTPGQDGESSEASEDDCTTMAILNIPYTYPKCKLQRLMEREGLTFNYFHFPLDARKGRNRGFAFVNFTTPEMAQAFRETFDNTALFHPGEKKEKSITIMPSSLQGFESNRALHPGAAARALKPTMQHK